MTEVKPVPDGFRTVTPHLTVDGAEAAIEFYEKAFGANCVFKSPMPGTDKLGNAMLAIGDSMVMLNDEFPDYGSFGPTKVGGTSVIVHLYIEDADAWFKRATEAGAKIEMPLMNTFWGDRYGVVSDPFGHRWAIATHIEDVPPEEMPERAAKAMAEMAPPQ
jgi:uncharacterized glyoxalase superfamily protein PhnB